MTRRPVSKSGGIYWALSAALIAFGFVAIFSIGVPFFVLGLILLALGRWRDRPGVIWPPVVGTLFFFVAYVLIAPARCTATATSIGAASFTTCSNFLGIDYSGAGAYDPPLWPALTAGLVVAVASALCVRLVLRRR